MADERIDIDVSGALRDIAQLSSGLDSLQKKAKSAGDAFDAAFSADEAQGVADALDDLQKQYDSLKKSADTLRNAMKSATNPEAIKIYAANIGKLEAGMKRLETTGKQVGVNLQKVNKEAGTGRQVFENFFGAFTKASIIIAAIEAVVKFTSYAVNLSQQITKAQKSFEGFTGSATEAKKIVDGLIVTGQKNFIPTDDILQAGKSLLAFGESADNLDAVLGRIADVSAATGKNFNELVTIYGKARTAGVLYAEDINQLVDAGVPIIQEFAKQMGVSNEQVKKLASEGKISFEELQLAIFNLTSESGKFADQSQNNASTISGAWTKLLSDIEPVTRRVGQFFSDVAQGFIFIAQDIVDAVKGVGEIKVEVDYTGRDAYEQAKDDLYERERLEKEAEAARRKRAAANAAELLKIQKERQKLELEAMKEGEEKEIALENFRYQELKKQLDKYHIDTTQATEQHQKNLTEITAKYAIQRFAAEQELIEMRKAQAEYEAAQALAGVEREKKRAEGIQKVRETEIDVLESNFANFIKAMEANGVDKKAIAQKQLEFDNLIKAYRLQNELKYQETLLGLIDKGDKDALEQAQNRIALIKSQLEGLTIAVPQAKGDGSTFLESLGFNEDQIGELQKGADSVIQILNEVAAASIQKAEEQIKAAQEQTKAAQDFYDEQKRLNEDGFANDLDIAEKRLQAAKQQEEKALAQKKKAQREQLLIESALQAANIATAAANTLKSFNGPLLPVGIALVAAMIGAFVAAKARALQATKFREGGGGYVDGRGIIVGRSHESGGVGFEAEGGEFFGTDGKRFGVVNKRMTAKHFDLLQAINLDDRSQMRKALAGLVAPMDRESVLSASGGSTAVIVSGTDQATYKLLKDWRNDQKNGVSITSAGGYLIERKGNKTRKIKVR